MLITEQGTRNHAVQADFVVASLQDQLRSIKTLICDIENNDTSPETLKHGIGGIETNLRKLREVI